MRRPTQNERIALMRVLCRKRTNVIVQWARHGRNVVTQNCTHLEEPSAVKSRAIWEEPLSMLATLYRVRVLDGRLPAVALTLCRLVQNPKDNSLEEKAYSFKIYESKGRKMGKCLASTSVNLSEYASVDGQNNKMTLELSSQMDAVDRALLRVTISCEAVANSDDKCVCPPPWTRAHPHPPARCAAHPSLTT